MSDVNAGDIVHWITDDESTKCAGTVVKVEDAETFVVRVARKFWSIEREQMGNDHCVVLSDQDILELESTNG